MILAFNHILIFWILFRVRIYNHSSFVPSPRARSHTGIAIRGRFLCLFWDKTHTIYLWLVARCWAWEYSSMQTMSRAHTFTSAWRLVIRIGIRFRRNWWRIAHSWRRPIVLKVLIFEASCLSLFPPCFSFFLLFSPLFICFRTFPYLFFFSPSWLLMFLAGIYRSFPSPLRDRTRTHKTFPATFSSPYINFFFPIKSFSALPSWTRFFPHLSQTKKKKKKNKQVIKRPTSKSSTPHGPICTKTPAWQSVK